jgi:uncharacterized protein (DUF305 family)
MNLHAVGRIAVVGLVIIAVLMTQGGAGRAQEGTPSAAGPVADLCAAAAPGNMPTMMTPGPMWPDMMTPGAMGPGMMMGDPELMILDMLRYHSAVDAAIAAVAAEHAEDPELRALAEAALSALQAESDQLNQWREQWFPGQPEYSMGPMMGPIMGMVMGPMMQSVMQGTPWPGMPAMPDISRMLPLMGMMEMGPGSIVAALCEASPVDAAVVDAMIVSAQMTQIMPQMMQQWVTRPELQQFVQNAAATRLQELEQLLQMRQSQPAAGTGTPTGG